MITGYTAGYHTGRLFTKVVKYYLAGKILKKGCLTVSKVAKCHKINSRQQEEVTKNIFECLEYID